MKKIDLEEEKIVQQSFDNLLRAQDKVTKEFAFLEDVDVKEFQAVFVKAQAKEICKYLKRLRNSPYKAWETAIMNIVNSEDEDFLYQFYIKKNEFEELKPDEDRINNLIMEDADPEEFPDSRR